MIFAGTMHFAKADFFLKIVPPYLSDHRALVYVSGVCETALGVLLHIPRFRPFAAWGIIVLLIADFPANIRISRLFRRHRSFILCVCCGEC